MIPKRITGYNWLWQENILLIGVYWLVWKILYLLTRLTKYRNMYGNGKKSTCIGQI
jgi:hypothetical protein